MDDWSEAILRERIESTRSRMCSTIEEIGDRMGADSVTTEPVARAGNGVRDARPSAPRGARRRAVDLSSRVNRPQTLLGRLSDDTVQLVHDELALARLELRDMADAFAEDVRDAGRTLARDVVRINVALSLAFLATLALAAGAVVGIGVLLDGAYWAGALVVGALLLVAAVIMARSAANEMDEMKDRDDLHVEHTIRTGRSARGRTG